MFTRFLATVSIGAVTIRPVFAMFPMILFVAMFWLVMSIRLVRLKQW